MRSMSNPMGNRRLPGGPSASGERDLSYEYRRKLGAWVREQRVKAGLTQQQLADRLGVTFTAISAVELGRNNIPPERYFGLADVLGVDRAELGKLVLRWSNPWLYACLFGLREHSLKEDLGIIPDRLNPREKPA